MKMPDFALNSVFAKVRALYGKHLTEKNYNELLQLDSINEIAEYLRTKTSYSEIFEGLSSTNELQRSRLETLLFNKMYNEMISVMRFQKAAGSKLYDYFIMKYDTQQIIKVLSSMETKSDNYFFTFPVFYNEHSKLDLYKLASAKNDIQLLEYTKNTIYYATLKDALSKYRLSGSLIAVQSDFKDFLDLQFIKLTAGTKKDKPDAKSEISNLYKRINDVELVENLYRMKRFSIHNQIEQNMQTPILTSFSKKELTTLQNASTKEEMDEAVKNTHLKHLLSDTEEADIYSALNEYLFTQLTRTVRRSSSPDAVMFAYFHLAEIEIRNIIHIIEGKRYSLSPEEIGSMLCGRETP